MKQQRDLLDITRYLSRIKSEIRINNVNGLTDVNHHCKDFFCKILNIILDLKLKNQNLEIAVGYPAIDLGDTEKGLCFQVTSECNGRKLKKTMSTYLEKGVHNVFPKLRFFLLNDDKKPRIKPDVLSESIGFKVSDDILNLGDIPRLIRGDESKIELILAFLREEFDQGGSKTEDVLANEMETITDLIAYLSSQRSFPGENWTEEPDPEGKIRRRFADHAAFLESEIATLTPWYAKSRQEVEKALRTDSVNIECIRMFIRTRSDRLLQEADGDARVALNNMTDELENALKRKGKKHDANAIRFFLLDELIKCNIFPNGFDD